MKSVLEADAIHQDISGTVNQSAFTLFYGQFRAAAPCVRHLITEAERRASTSLTEYTTLVQDLQSNYLSCRMQLLQPSVKTAVSQLGTVHTRDHMRLVRAGYAFLPHVCEDEHQMQTCSSQRMMGRHQATARGVPTCQEGSPHSLQAIHVCGETNIPWLSKVTQVFNVQIFHLVTCYQ